MKHRSVGLAAFLVAAFPIAVAAAQPAGDESDPAPGDLAPDDGTISHESEEVIGPDDGPAPVEADVPEVAAEHAAKTAGYDKASSCAAMTRSSR